MDLILEMAAAAVGSSSFFWFSGSAAEIIPIAAAIAAIMTATAAAKIFCPNRNSLRIIGKSRSAAADRLNSVHLSTNT